MRVAVVSDTHNRYKTVDAVLSLLREHGVGLVLHCGDIEDAEVVRRFHGLTTHFVFGNCDDDREGLRRAMAETGATLHEHFGSLQLAGKNIAWTHGDDKRLFRDIEASGHYDYLFYGHTHHAEQHQSGPTLVLNPGALHRARVKTFIVLDLKTGQIESVAVD
jgi:putative phosphoesterase